MGAFTSRLRSIASATLRPNPLQISRTTSCRAQLRQYYTDLRIVQCSYGILRQQKQDKQSKD